MPIKRFYKLYLVPDIFIDQQYTVEEVHQCRLKRNCVHRKVIYLTDLFICDEYEYSFYLTQSNHQMIEVCHCESTYTTDKLTFCVFLFVSLMCPFSSLAEINYISFFSFFAFLSY